MLAGARGDVPRARAFAAGLLGGAAPELVANAEMVVSELVTNAMLHGQPPVRVRLTREDDLVRVEVEDRGHGLPMQALRGAEAMTGRGLRLVSALSTDWGVRRTDDGKAVWALVGGSPDLVENDEPFLGVEELLAVWDDQPAGEERHAVRLGAVPTGLLLAAKAHVDNVARELALLRGERACDGVELPDQLVGLVTAVVDDFAEARTAIKRQALAAARRGDPVVELELRLPLSAADAGERYLAALDELDRLARAGRLLSLAPPRSHREFRRWYVRALMAQLRAASAGKPAPTPEPFPQVLAAEVDRLATLELSWQRLQLLQRISADLTVESSVEEIADTVVVHAGSHPLVLTARVFLVTDRRTLRAVAFHGTDASQPHGWDEFPLDADLPGSIVARSGQPMFLRSRAQVADRFPALAGYYPTERSVHIVPLGVGDDVLGILSLTLAAGDVTDGEQVAFVQAIADVLAQATDRAQTHARAATERERDARLVTAQLDVLADMVAGVPLPDALGRLLREVEAASADGMLASVLLLDRDGVHLRHCAAPNLPDSYTAAIDGVAVGPAVGSCGTAAYRGEQVIVEDVAVDPLWTDYRDVALAAGLHACWSTPIIGADGAVLGTFAMYYPRPRQPSSSDRTLIRVLVRTVTMAVERARADEDRARELASERAAALTLQHSLLPTVPDRVGQLEIQTHYRTGDPGVDVGGDWFDALAAGERAVLIVGDVQGHDLQAAALMGQLRTVAHAAAADGRRPSQVLDAMHRYLADLDTDLLTTALVVQIDAHTGRAYVACAGHLPPLAVTPSAGGWCAVELVVDPGPPLGVGHQWPQTTAVLPPDTVLLLYTDGLVETRRWPLDHGLALLRKSQTALPPDAGLGSFLEAALDLLPSGSRLDDVALLGARIRAPH